MTAEKREESAIPISGEGASESATGMPSPLSPGNPAILSSCHPVILSSRHPVTPSPLRAWFYLIWLSWQRQARARLMVWIALGLLAFFTFIVVLNTQAGRWSMAHWRSPPRVGQSYGKFVETMQNVQGEMPWDISGNSARFMAAGAYGNVVHQGSGFFVFSNWVVFSIFTTFLLPLWTLSFATDALGREREAGNMLWLLTRPLPRPAIYLAKFVATLPWCLGLNVGGFALICLAAGAPGRLALAVYWPAVLWGTLAFAALFHLLGAWLRRAAVAAILYSFFLETIMGNLPGHLKRLSLSFYTRCLMFDRAHDLGIHPERPNFYLPVSGTTAWCILAGATVVLLGVGMVWFSRSEYLDVS